ncbi:hypothetical protein CYY_000790 [Polysphondylium violaceum]|uniref:Uncharacterized protein n=1 Tax=Polysphondylium violaceum TaxID=133409 RepID=A0A8J4V8K5_9MYCE|nr:hypothetical protein CYY_000790 [Polysphondylium violaceum]
MTLLEGVELQQLLTTAQVRDSKIMACLATIVMFLMALKIFYIFFIEKLNGVGAKLKFWANVLNFLYLFLTCITLYVMVEGSTLYISYNKFLYFVEMVSGILCIASVLLIYLHWVGMIQNVFKINNGRILTPMTRWIFFGFFLIPGSVLAIIYLAMVMEEADLRNEEYFAILKKVYYYYSVISTSLIIFLLWGYLAYQLIIMSDLTRQKTKRFFITSYLFSGTSILIVITHCMAFFFTPNDYGWKWASFIIIIIFDLELIFVVYPVNIHRIRKFFDANYVIPSDQISNPTNGSTQASKSDNIQVSAEPASQPVGNVQP